MKSLVATATLLAVMLAVGCDGRIYVRDGVTDGDTFYLPEYVVYDDDPALQSWVAYSLDLSTCQLTIGGENPSRNSSFDCEYGAREALVETWLEQKARKPVASDAYLDTLSAVRDAGLLREYVADHYRREGWQLPGDLDTVGYAQFKRRHLNGHRSQRRIVGSWNYSARRDLQYP